MSTSPILGIRRSSYQAGNRRTNSRKSKLLARLSSSARLGIGKSPFAAVSTSDSSSSSNEEAQQDSEYLLHGSNTTEDSQLNSSLETTTSNSLDRVIEEEDDSSVTARTVTESSVSTSPESIQAITPAISTDDSMLQDLPPPALVSPSPVRDAASRESHTRSPPSPSIPRGPPPSPPKVHSIAKRAREYESTPPKIAAAASTTPRKIPPSNDTSFFDSPTTQSVSLNTSTQSVSMDTPTPTKSNQKPNTTTTNMYILLLHPVQKVFELVQVPQRQEEVSDILASLPLYATEPLLKRQPYRSLVQPHKYAPEEYTSIDGNCNVWIAVPHDTTATIPLIRLAKQILKHPRIRHLTKSKSTKKKSSSTKKVKKKNSKTKKPTSLEQHLSMMTTPTTITQDDDGELSLDLSWASRTSLRQLEDDNDDDMSWSRPTSRTTLKQQQQRGGGGISKKQRRHRRRLILAATGLVVVTYAVAHTPSQRPSSQEPLGWLGLLQAIMLGWFLLQWQNKK